MRTRKVKKEPVFNPPVMNSSEGNEEFEETKQKELVGTQQSIKKSKQYIFKPIREEILKRASWKNGVTVTGLVNFLSDHPERNRLVEEIHYLNQEGKITIDPVQIRQEAVLYGGSWQTQVKTI